MTDPEAEHTLSSEAASEQVADAVKKIAEAGQQLHKTLGRFAHVLRAQIAFGRMCDGELEEARASLRLLPRDVLQEVSVAGAALSSLADEVAAEER